MAQKKSNGKSNKNTKNAGSAKGKKSSSIKVDKTAKKVAKTIAAKHPILVFMLVVIIIVAGVAGYFIYNKFYNKQKEIKGEFSVHFLELGNSFAGDCVYIKAGETDVLIDAGSRPNSVPTIQNYINNYVTDGKLEYVIATHADRDHIAGFAADNGIFDLYKCDTIIDFAKTNKTSTTYSNYVAKRDKEVQEGAKHYTALECYNNVGGAQREYVLAEGITMSVLYNYYYENHSDDENNYSVCILITQGSRNFLFTGDLEKEGEEKLVLYNDLPQVEVYKAGHHGSKTSSNNCLLDVIKPKIVCVCCCAGSVEYTQIAANTFPTQDFINRIAKHTDKVYVTTYVGVHFDAVKNKYVNDDGYKLMNGNIVIISNAKSDISVECSENNTILKDTAWFINNRTMPNEWKNAS